MDKMKKQIFILYGKRATGKTLLLNLIAKNKAEIIDDVILVYDKQTGLDTGRELAEKIEKSTKQFIVISIYKADHKYVESGVIFDELQLLTDRLDNNYLVTICNMEKGR